LVLADVENWFNAGAPEAAADPLIADSSCLGES
jgi:hypothetical protein